MHMNKGRDLLDMLARHIKEMQCLSNVCSLDRQIMSHSNKCGQTTLIALCRKMQHSKMDTRIPIVYIPPFNSGIQKSILLCIFVQALKMVCYYFYFI